MSSVHSIIVMAAWPPTNYENLSDIILPLDGGGLRWGWTWCAPLTLALSPRGEGIAGITF